MNRLDNTVEVIAEELAKTNVVLTPVHDSVVTSLLDNDSGYVDELTTALSNTIRKKIGVIKTDMMPAAIDYADAVSAELDRVTPTNPVSEVVVRRVFKYDIIEQLVEQSHIPAYMPAGAIPRIPETSLSIVLTPAEVASKAKFNSVILDTMLEDVIADKNSAELHRIVAPMLELVGRENSMLGKMATSAVTELHNNIIRLAVVTNIAGDPDTDYKEEWMTALGDLRRFISLLIVRGTGELDTAVESKRLVLGYGDNELIVSMDVLSEALDSVEFDSIIGTYFVPRHDRMSNTYLNAIIANKAILEETYKREYSRAEAVIVTGLRDRLMALYPAALPVLYNTLPDTLADVTVPVNKAPEIINMILSPLSLTELSDIPTVCRHIAGSLVVDTYFIEFTDKMNELSVINPDLSSDDVASLASLDMILEYLLQQVIKKQR